MNTLDEIMEAFLRFSPPDMRGKYELGRIRELMNLLNNPQEKVSVIHVAGTSGKTSTSYFIRNLLEATGQKTGLTVSPHITGINERVQIHGKPLEPDIFVRYANEFLEFVSNTPLMPTYFELLIALAYKIFALEKVEYAVIETGLGGLLDGTNVVTRKDKLCIITDIGLDHTEILGDTVEKIALQKAGIIQTGNHVIMNKQSPEIMDVFKDAARKKQATIEIIDETDDKRAESLPYFQRRNWRLAKAAYEFLRKRDGLPVATDVQLHEAMSNMPPGRFEIYNIEDKTVILDGAHNPQKLQSLCDSLEDASVTSAVFLMNLVEAPEAKIKSSLKIVQPYCSHLIIPEFKAGQDLKSRRSLSVDNMTRYAEAAGLDSFEAHPDPKNALDTALKRSEKTLIITGSLYLVSVIRKLLQDI